MGPEQAVETDASYEEIVRRLLAMSDEIKREHEAARRQSDELSRILENLRMWIRLADKISPEALDRYLDDLEAPGPIEDLAPVDAGRRDRTTAHGRWEGTLEHD